MTPNTQSKVPNTTKQARNQILSPIAYSQNFLPWASSSKLTGPWKNIYIPEPCTNLTYRLTSTTSTTATATKSHSNCRTRCVTTLYPNHDNQQGSTKKYSRKPRDRKNHSSKQRCRKQLPLDLIRQPENSNYLPEKNCRVPKSN